MSARTLQIRVLILIVFFLVILIGNSWGQNWSGTFVLGQTNTVNKGDNALDGNDMAFPNASYSAGGKYFVCDYQNNRVLVWNSVPTNSGAVANVVVGQSNVNQNAVGPGVNNFQFAIPNMFSDGTKLYVADPFRHRVLIWNSIPSSNAAPASVVVGQTNFTESSSGTTQAKLNTPMAVAAAAGKLFVVDNQNHRVLIWNSIPTSNGAPASVVVGQSSFTNGTSGLSSTKLTNPQGIASNGTNLWIADSQNNRVLKYNSIPGANGAAANVVLGQSTFTNNASGSGSSKMNFPMGLNHSGTKLSVADMSNNRVMVWNTIPTTNNTPASFVLGQPNFNTVTNGCSASALSNPEGVSISGGKMFVADRGNMRTLIWNSVPSTNNTPASLVQGHTNFSYNTHNDTDAIGLKPLYNGGMHIAGNKLFVADNENRRVLIWNSLPTSTAQPADVVLGQKDLYSADITFTASSVNPAGIYSDGTRLFVADEWRDRVLIWNTIPTTNNTPANVVVGQTNFFDSNFGTAQNRLKTPGDVFAVNGKLIVADSGNNRVLIWNTIPAANGANADVVIGQSNFTNGSSGLSAIKLNNPRSIVSDGVKLVVSDTDNNRALVYNMIPVTNSTPASVVVGQATFTNNVASIGSTTASLLYGPEQVRISPAGKLYVADGRNNRVLVYSGIPAVNGTAADTVMGQTNFTVNSSGCATNKFQGPSAIAVSTNRVYVADAYNCRLVGGNLPNLPPILAPIGNRCIGVDQTLTLVVSATDPDGGPSALSYSASNLPSGASFNPSTRTLSWTPTASQVGTYSNVHFEVSDGDRTDSEDITIDVVWERYGFETGVEGWTHSTYQFGAACTNVVQSNTQATSGSYSLKMNMNLVGGDASLSSGEASVDMRATPPSGTVIPVNLSNRVVRASVFCPTGSLGNPSAPNGIQLFLKDQEFDSQYSGFSNIVENSWMTVSMTGTSSGNFDAGKVISVGVKMGAGGGSTNAYNGPIYVDAYSFPIPAVAPSDHVYNFETGSQDNYPRWAVDPGFQASAWTNAVLSSGRLAMSSSFVTGGDESLRKGFIGITYQPDLYLANKDHRVIHVELKFDPVPQPYQFVGQIWVYDHGEGKWYVSDNKDVGAGVDWNVMEFDLDDHTEYNPDLSAGQTMPLEQILTVGVQLYANSNYTGTIYLDKVSIGGEEIASNYVQLNTALVGRSGTNFVVNGTNWYFAGANAEYLIKRPMPVVQQVLTSATNMNLRLVRTWAFDEGKPWSIQPERGKWNEAALEHLDRIIAEAGKRGLRLLLALVDNWGHNGGMYKYMDWVAAEYPETMTGLTPNTIPYHDEFFTNPYAKQWYKDYVSMLLNRTNTVTGIVYKNDAAVMGWEIVNEPRNETDVTGAEIHNWIKEMSDYVRSHDANHLLAAGVEGGYITTYSNANTRAYQSFPDNYWQYGLKKEAGNVSANADFISDALSTNHVMQWQEGTYDNPGTIHNEQRDGIPNVDFVTCRLYVDQHEYNLWRTNSAGYDQRLEWMSEHRQQAHEIIGKPIIVEEFGIHADYGYTYNGSFAEIRFDRDPVYTASQRADIFETFYDHIECTGINGSLFWNLGYDGVFVDPLNMCEATTNWTADTTGSDATAISLNTNASYIIEGSGSLKMDYNSSGGYGKAWYNLNNLSEKWIRRLIDNLPDGENRVKFVWNVYNPGSAITCAVAVSTTSNLTWHEAPTKTLNTGWNELVFDLSAKNWKSAATSWQYNGAVSNLEDVRRVSIGLFGYSGTGSVYTDDVTIWFDDGFIIYPEDPAVTKIRTHGTTMNAK